MLNKTDMTNSEIRQENIKWTLWNQNLVSSTKGLVYKGHTLLCMYLAEHFSGCLVLQRHTVHRMQSTFDAKGLNSILQTILQSDKPIWV